MNLILKSFGQSVAFLMFDAALSIFFEHTINIREKLFDKVSSFNMEEIKNFNFKKSALNIEIMRILRI